MYTLHIFQLAIITMMHFYVHLLCIHLDSIRVSTVLRQPFNLYKPGIVDSFIHGLINQKANAMDPEVTTEVSEMISCIISSEKPI